MSTSTAVQPVDVRIALITQQQHGVITIGQLLELGLSHGQVATRVRNGRLIRVHPGVYAIAGVDLTTRGRWTAAVLAGNKGTALYGACALELAGVLRRPAGTIEVVSPGATPKLTGIRTHRTRWLAERQTCSIAGIRTTSASRALVDYAYQTDVHELAGVMHQLAHRGKLDVREILTIDERLSNRRGTTDLILATEHYRKGSQGAFSGPERFLLCSVREAGLPIPLANVVVDTPRGPFLIDAYWDDRPCAYELNWKQDHDRPTTKARDSLKALGFREAGIPLIDIDLDTMYADIDGTIARIARMLGL